MSAILKRLISTALEAGYQVSEEALKLMANSKDPFETLNEAISHILEKYPGALVIEERHVQSVLEVEKEKKETPPVEETVTISVTEEAKPPHRPLATEYTSELEILQAETEDKRIRGDTEEFRRYFHSRYIKLRRILEKRRERFIALAEAAEAKGGEETAVVASIYGKRETRRAIMLDVEDPTRKLTVTLPRSNSPTVEKAEELIHDQVIGLKLKKFGETLIVQDILQPDVPATGPRTETGVPPLSVALVSDLHVGSHAFCEDAFQRFTAWLRDGEDEIAGSIKYVVIAGDIVDGIGIYPRQEKELALTDVEEQLVKAAELLAGIPNYVEIVFSPGNHDPTRKPLPQLPIPEKYREILSKHRNIVFVGNPAWIQLHARKLLIYHGQSLDDIIQTMPRVSYSTLKENIGVILEAMIRARHLAPQYGENTALIPLEDDPLVIDDVPDILHTGHVHVVGVKKYKGIALVNSGSWQQQTEYQGSLGLTPTPPSAVIVDLRTLSTNVRFFG